MTTHSTVYRETAKILKQLDNTRDLPSTRAILAAIRGSINSDQINTIDALSFVFSNLPEDILGSGDELNEYEQAIITAVQMYALHQQANAHSVLAQDNKNMGNALSILRSLDSKSIDRRFNAMITSKDFIQLRNHLRQLIKLLKAKAEVQVDYARLADDLFWFLKNRKQSFMIEWARSYYRITKENSKGDN